MKNNRYILLSIFLISAILACAGICAAETIVLKSGEKIDANVIGKNDKFVKVDFRGAMITYHAFEIDTIDGKKVDDIKNTASDETLEFLMASTASEKERRQVDIVTPAEYFERGRIFHSKGMFDNAISNFDEAIKRDPKLAIAYLYRGLSYGSRGDMNRAIADYDKAIEINPKGTEAYFFKGLAYMDRNEPEKAILEHTKALEVNPKYLQAYLKRAFAYVMEGDNDRAIADANRAIKLEPKSAEAYYVRGIAFVNEKNIEEAIADYTKAIELRPNYVEAYLNRALAYGYREKVEEAKTDPNSSKNYINVGAPSVSKENLTKALADCSKAIELNRKFTEAYTARARIYYLNNDFDKAWDDVHDAEDLGAKIKPEFLAALQKASGRSK